MPIVPEYRPPRGGGRRLGNLGDEGQGQGPACCTSCATAEQRAAMMRQGARLVQAAVASGRRPAGMPPQGLQGLGDLFGASVSDAIRALGPVNSCMPSTEAARVLASYEAQVNAQLHNMSEAMADQATHSVSKSILLRQSLPDQVCRPSDEFNSIVYMVTELWQWLVTTQASIQIVDAAWTEATQVAIDKAKAPLVDAAAGFQSLGDTLLALTKATRYLPWFLGAAAAVALAPTVLGAVRKYHRRVQEA